MDITPALNMTNQLSLVQLAQGVGLNQATKTPIISVTHPPRLSSQSLRAEIMKRNHGGFFMPTIPPQLPEVCLDAPLTRQGVK